MRKVRYKSARTSRTHVLIHANSSYVDLVFFFRLRTPPDESKENSQELNVKAPGGELLTPRSWQKHDDGYGRRAHDVLDAICAIQAPEGLIVWLDEHSPSLYDWLTQDLPDEVSRAWNSKIPLEAFDALCSDLVDTFRRAAELYRATEQLQKGSISGEDGRNNSKTGTEA
jgi:hypothetical protein